MRHDGVGTTELGLALVGTALGHPVHIVTDPGIDPITLAKLETLGCAVHVVEAMSGAGWQSARLERLARLLTELPGASWPRQYANPENPGQRRVAVRHRAGAAGEPARFGGGAPARGGGP